MAVAKGGEAGGVWVEARGRNGLSRGSSAAPLECRCRFLRKLRPRRPDGRGDVGLGERAVAATVGAAGAGAVNITESGADKGVLAASGSPAAGVNGVSTTFDRHATQTRPFTQPYALQYTQGKERSCTSDSGDAAKQRSEE
jgi:hypothetical protein